MTARKILTRDFILSFFAQVAFSSVFFILIPTIPIYLSRLGATEAGIGVLVGALSVSSLVLRPFIGRALLKTRERDFMIAGSLLFAISSVAYLFATPFWPFLIVRILQGIGLALFATASFTLVVRISPVAHRGQSINYFYLAINVAFALAPSFGIALINHFNFSVLFLVCAGLSLGSLFISLKLKKEETDSLDDRSIKGQPLLSRGALPPAIMSFMGSTIWGAVTAFFPLYAIHHGVSNPGLFFGALAISLISARSFGGKILDLYAREKILLPCIAAQIIAMALLAFSTNLPMFILVAVIWGLGNAFYYPTLVAYAIDLAGPSHGPAIGTYMALSDFGAGMGAVIMGIVLQLSNYTVMFLCLSLTGVLNLFYFLAIVRKKPQNLLSPAGRG
jgi:predicted MFS family arabinose efflux permease